MSFKNDIQFDTKFITSLKNLFNPTGWPNTSHKTNYLSFPALLDTKFP